MPFLKLCLFLFTMSLLSSCKTQGDMSALKAIEASTVAANSMEANSLNFSYLSAGKQGDPLLFFLHGYPAFKGVWKPYLENFGSQGYFAVAPDLRGYNDSDKPEGIANYDLDILVEDVHAMIEKLGYGQQKITLVAHDWGGIIAWYVAKKYPDLIQKLVILNAPHPARYKDIYNTPKQLLKKYYIDLLLTDAGYKVVSAADFGFLRLNVFSSLNRDKPLSKDEIEAYKSSWKKSQHYSLYYYKSFIPKLAAFADRMRSEFPTETLLFWSSRDAAFDNSAFKDLKKSFPLPRTTLCEKDSTHWLPEDRASEIMGDIASFLQGKVNAISCVSTQ